MWEDPIPFLRVSIFSKVRLFFVVTKFLACALLSFVGVKCHRCTKGWKFLRSPRSRDHNFNISSSSMKIFLST